MLVRSCASRRTSIVTYLTTSPIFTVPDWWISNMVAVETEMILSTDIRVGEGCYIKVSRRQTRRTLGPSESFDECVECVERPKKR